MMHVQRIKIIVLLLCVIFSSLSFGQGAQIQGPRDAEGAYSGVVYGPIDANDTLWGIASRYRQDQQFTVYQVMMAIYELNQEAFEEGNFNRMVSGSTLLLPSDRFIARISPELSKAKAERDDRTLTQLLSQTAQSDENNESLNNLKPDIPLVNRDDLSETERQLQSQLNAIKRQQNRLFDEIKDQMDTSIGNTQSIVDNNDALLTRLNQNEADFLAFRSTLENNFQARLDEQSEQIKQLTDLVKLAQERDEAERSNSIMSILSSPIAIVTLSAVLSLSMLCGFGYWLFKRKTPDSVSQKKQAVTTAPVEDIVDDELIIGESDEPFESDADDLLDALSSDDDDAILDDILSDELEESIDEVAISSDEFDGIGDDMLVPDQPAKDASNSQTNEDDLSEIDENSINLDKAPDEDELLEPDAELSKSMVDELLDQENEEQLIEHEFDENEDARDSLVESEEDSDLPDGVSLDSDGEIDEQTLSQIEASISEKDSEITSLTEQIEDGLESALLEEKLAAEAAEVEEVEPEELDAETDIEISEEIISIETDDIVESVSDEKETLEPDEQSILDSDELLTTEELNEQGAQLAEELLNDLEESVEDQEDTDDLDKLLAEMEANDDLSVDESLEHIPSLNDEIKSEESLIDVLDSQTDQNPDKLEVAEEDILSELPDLDEWLDEEGKASSESDSELLDEIENSDFDALLEEVEAISQGQINESEIEDTLALDNEDLDLSALLDDQADQNEEKFAPKEDFVDVDALLEESESATPLSDDDLALDIDLNFPDIQGAESSDSDVSSYANTGVGSNLDLAQVYIDMGDLDSAKEALESVIEQGDEQQRVEAKKLLNSIQDS